MQSNEIVKAILMYSAASGTMLIINKVVLKSIPMPSLVSSIQFIFATLIVSFLKFSKLQIVDDYKWENVKPYLYYIVAFVGGIYSNMRVLAVTNVETVIVFRTCTPIIVSLLDYLFLGRALPGRRSTGAMLLIVAGACGYVLTDKEFALNGWSAYTWVIIYMIIICFEMTYGKHIIKSVKMKNKVLGAVYYTNSIAILPMFALGFGVFGEGDKFGTFEFKMFGIIVLLISCVIGTCISYAAFNCRNLVSATTFTLVGVINKMITILINTLIWDNHASMFGILSLMVCILGGTLYKQAPLRYEHIEKPEHEEDEITVLVKQNNIELAATK